MKMCEIIRIVEGPDPDEKRAKALIQDVMRFARSAKVRIVMKYPAFNAPEIEITDFFANTPGQGAGTKVMIYLCKRADEANFNLYLKPESPRNVKFYGRFGFTRSSQHFGMLVRYPEVEMDDDDREE